MQKYYTEELRSLLGSADALVNDITITSASKKQCVAVSLFDLSHEHAKGICSLVEQKLYSPAWALGRPAYEAYVKGCWLLHCATETEVERFLEKEEIKSKSAPKKNMHFSELVEEVSLIKDFNKSLININKSIWNILNSFTHGGIHQLSRRLSGTTIGPQDEDEDVNGLLRLGALCSFLSTCELIDLSDTQADHKGAITKIYDELKLWAFSER